MGSVHLALVAAEPASDRLDTALTDSEAALTVETVVDPTALAQERAEFDETDCVVLVDAAIESPIRTLYEQLRIAYPTLPAVVISPCDDRAFIDDVLADANGDIVYHPDRDLAPQLIAARCQRLTETTEFGPGP